MPDVFVYDAVRTPLSDGASAALLGSENAGALLGCEPLARGLAVVLENTKATA